MERLDLIAKIKNYNLIIPDTIGKGLYEFAINNLPYFIIWMGKKKWSEHVRRRTELLRHLLKDFPDSYLLCYDCDDASALKGDWQKLSQQEWIIPNNVDCDELYKMLHMQDWFIYKPETLKLDSVKGYDLGNYMSLIKLVRENNLIYILRTLPDDNPWFLGFNDMLIRDE